MKVISLLLVVLALVVGILPQFTDCASQGKAIALPNGKTIPMKCHWTARAELGVAVPLLVVGLALGLAQRKESRRILALLGVLLGVLVALLPTMLIGVCSSGMPCDVIMQPTLILSGILIAAGSVAAFVVSERRAEVAA